MPWISYHELFARNQARLEASIKQQIRDRDPHYIEQKERDQKDTKPDFYTNTSDPSRTIVTVGAGQKWFEDLKDLSKRTLEKPNPKLDPRYQRDLRTDVATAIDIIYRQAKGRSVFHIKNNPLAKEV